MVKGHEISDVSDSRSRNDSVASRLMLWLGGGVRRIGIEVFAVLSAGTSAVHSISG